MLAAADDRVRVDWVGTAFARHAERLMRPSPLARVMSVATARSLDRALTKRADPARGPALAARAARLTSRRTRRSLAQVLEQLASGPEAGRWRVLPSRPAVDAVRAELSDLAELLRGSRPVYAAGMARLRQLVSDGTGPLFTDRTGSVLAGELRRVRAAIADESPSPAGGAR